jgi:hypothetical protein
MNYYVISDTSGDKSVKGVIFHDYSKSHFSVHSNSDVLQLAIDLAVKSVKSFRLVKVSDTLAKVMNFDINSPFWASTVAKKVVGDGSWWEISSEGIINNVEMEDFLRKVHLYNG